MDDIEKLIQALTSVSPMPSDDDPELTPEKLDSYAELIQQILNVLRSSQLDEETRLIIPLLNSFGYGDGYGVYWLTLSALEKFPISILRPALGDALKNGERGTRMWCAIMLGRTRDPANSGILVSSLKDAEIKVRISALEALALIRNLSSKEAIKELYDDPVEEVRQSAIEAMSALTGAS